MWGGACILESATPPISRKESSRAPQFWTLFCILCLHSLTQNCDIRHGNIYEEGIVFRRSAMPLYICTNESCGLSYWWCYCRYCGSYCCRILRCGHLPESHHCSGLCLQDTFQVSMIICCTWTMRDKVTVCIVCTLYNILVQQTYIRRHSNVQAISACYYNGKGNW